MKTAPVARVRGAVDRLSAVEDVGLVTFVRRTHPVVPVVVAVADEPQQKGPPKDKAEADALVGEFLGVLGDSVLDGRYGNRTGEHRYIGHGDSSADPVILGMPPDLGFLELAFVEGVQDEPVVVPDQAENEVAAPDDGLSLPAPRHPHGKMPMKDENGQGEHEDMVAGDWPLADEFVVPMAGAIPGRHLVGPAVAAFAFDLYTAEDCGENAYECAIDKDTVQGAPPL